MKKSKLLTSLSVLGIITAIAGITWATFGDKSEILGSSFTVGSADIKLLKNLSNGVGSENLTDSLTGPQFVNITPNWTQDYLLKIYNNAPDHIQLTSLANYETANDPQELRQLIFVEIINWTDPNNNGQLEEGELGSSFGKKSIVKWKTEGFDLSSMTAGQTKGLLLRFSTGSIADSKQGATALFDFAFNSLTVE